MTSQQRRVVLIGLGVAGLLGLFPPWRSRFPVNDTWVEVNQGYHFLFSAPTNVAWIDFGRLVTSWVVVTVLATVLAFALEGPTTENVSGQSVIGLLRYLRTTKVPTWLEWLLLIPLGFLLFKFGEEFLVWLRTH